MDWQVCSQWAFRDVGASNISWGQFSCTSDYYYYAYFDSTNIFTRTLLKTAIWECVNAPDPKGIYNTVV